MSAEMFSQHLILFRVQFTFDTTPMMSNVNWKLESIATICCFSVVIWYLNDACSIKFGINMEGNNHTLLSSSSIWHTSQWRKRPLTVMQRLHVVSPVTHTTTRSPIVNRLNDWVQPLWHPVQHFPVLFVCLLHAAITGTCAHCKLIIQCPKRRNTSLWVHIWLHCLSQSIHRSTHREPTKRNSEQPP